MSPIRVVSLVPSVTETLSAWGVEPVACTRFCERPDLVHVGGTKNPDIEAIVDLAPDLVVVERHENRREDADALAAVGLSLLDLEVDSLAGLHAQMAVLADAVGVQVPDPVEIDVVPIGVTAFVPIWRRPWMTIAAGTFGTSLLAALGVSNVCAGSAFGAASAYPEVDLADIALLAPDLVLVPSEPYEFADAHLRELSQVAPPTRVDGQDLFWWGARTQAALVRLHARLSGAADAIPDRHRLSPRPVGADGDADSAGGC